MTLVVHAAPDAVRGYVRRFLVPVDDSVFVGVLSAKVADELWRVVGEHLGEEGSAVLVRSSPSTELGVTVTMMGTRRSMRDFDGLTLPVVD